MYQRTWINNTSSDCSKNGAMILCASRTLRVFFKYAIVPLIATLCVSSLQPTVAVADDLPKRKALSVLPLAPVGDIASPSLTPPLPTDDTIAGEFAGNASSDVVAAILCFSADNRFLLIGDTSSKKNKKDSSSDQLFARLWDLRSGKELRRFAAGKHDGFSSLQMSKTQKLVAGIAKSSNRPVTGSSSSLLLWDADTGEEYMHQQFGLQAGESFKPEFVAFSPDSEQLFVVDGNGYSLRSLNVGHILSKGQTDHQWSCDGVLHSQPLAAPSRHSIFVSGYHRTPYVFDGNTFYTTVGEVLEVSSESGKIINRFATGDESSFFLGKHLGRGLALSSDDRLLATASSRRDLDIRDTRTGNVLRAIKCEVGIDSAVACFTTSDRRLLATLDDGKTREWDLETGKETFNFITGNPCAISTDGTLVAGYRRVEDSSKESSSRIEITHVPTRRRLMALYPSHEAREYKSEVSSLAQGDVEAFMASHLDKKVQNSQSQATSSGSELKDERGRLFLLTIGVSKHKFPEYDLKYAAADAEALVDFFRKSESDLYREVYVASITNEEASAERIIQAIEWTKEACSVKDVCIITFSGHGIKGKKGLYFVCHEGDANGMQYTCLNWSKVGEAIAAINARQTMILADCCHAGAFAVEHSGPQSKLIEAFADRENVFIFSSSHGDQPSLELPQKKHGAFTAAILDSLRGAADSDNNGVVTLGELQRHVTMEVQRMTSGKQSPTVPFPDRYNPNTELIKVQ